MPNMPDKDVIVIGAGVAGLTAAKLAAEQGYSTMSIESVVFGGLVLNINELDGEPHGSGAEYASNLLMQISDLGVESVAETVTGLTRVDNAIKVDTDQGSHSARAVIIASGAHLKKLGVPGEAEFQDRGVAHCADCDGPMYQGQTAVVVGGGDSALQEALVLAQYAQEVQVLHRGTAFRAKKHLADAVAAKSNIVVKWNTVVEEIRGGEMVESVRAKNTANGNTEDIACSGIFSYVGLAPNSEFAPAQIKDGNGLIKVEASMQTGMPGVLAIGAVRSGHGGLLVHAIADAEAAAAALKKMLG
jgi:thioredoxin reductase (NADPH)